MPFGITYTDDTMGSPKPSQIETIVETFDYCESELVIALVYAVGTDYKPVQRTIEELLTKHGYIPRTVRISDLIGSLTDHPLEDSSEIAGCLPVWTRETRLAGTLAVATFGH